MGMQVGPPTWAEMERVLSGRLAGGREAEPVSLPRPAAPSAAPDVYTPGAVPYAELHAHSAYSFLDGASEPAEMAAEAARLGLSALALTDHDGLYGAVQFAEAARDTGLRTVFGAELSLDSGHLLVLARGQEGYRRLSRQIAAARMAGGAKGALRYNEDALADAAGGHWQILTGCRSGQVRRALDAGGPAAAREALADLVERFGSERVTVELAFEGVAEDAQRNTQLADVAAHFGLHTVAATNAHYAEPSRRRLAMAMAAVRARSSLDAAAGALAPAGGAHLRSGAEMARLFQQHPEAVARAAVLGQECAFDLRLVAPNLPPYPVPQGHTEISWLRVLSMEGAAGRYGPPAGNPAAYRQLEHELRVIEELNFPGYFLIVHNFTQFCKERGILCQGRGSAANSAVCYAIGITNVDPVANKLLFERFLSPERDGPPDIDVDIESGRREEVIQYVYGRYGREYAAQVANVITYRGRSSVRDAAKALGFSQGQQDAWSKQISRWTDLSPNTAPDIPAGVLALAAQFEGMPRHLGIHSGGMVICDRPIADVCPTEWARMAGRSVLQWDKDDCAAAGLVKFDMLGLGMLSALRHMIDLAKAHKGIEVDLARLDLSEAAVYEMLSRGDSVGVFQVESRAQIATLPRIKPRCFFDLVVQVAIIRPGPIQGGSVHPYIRRRNGHEPITYDHPSLKPSLERTLGIPLFQEQLMQMAVDAAGFTPAEADQLRRAMGSKRSAAKMERLHTRFQEGMAKAHGVTDLDVVQRIWEKLRAFANYGFPESHSQSFASLVFYSAWFKLHHPAIFCAGLLRAQPMGFYSPQSLVADARRHGVQVRGPDINASEAKATVEEGGTRVRLGLAQVRGIGEELAQRIAESRGPAGYRSFAELARAVPLTTAQAEALSTAGALGSTGLARREALWAAGAAASESPSLLPGLGPATAAPALPGMSVFELAAADVWATGISPDIYPTQFLRERLDAQGVVPAAGLPRVRDGDRVWVGGAVTHRQRPATGAGVTFINLEDETGMVNVLCTVGLWQRYRHVARAAPAMLVRGIVQNAEGAVTVLADRLEPLELPIAGRSRDFR
jgi:error-prone DNA polymerase